jgi:hypothetical protein
VWQERFPLQDAHLDWLLQVLRDQGALSGECQTSHDIPIGSGSEQLTDTVDGRHITIPAFVSESRGRVASVMFTAARALVPPPMWERLTAAQVAYIAKYAA